MATSVIGLIILVPMVTLAVLLICHAVVGYKLIRLRRTLLAHVAGQEPDWNGKPLAAILKASPDRFQTPESEYLTQRYRVLRLYFRILFGVEIALLLGISAIIGGIVWIAQQLH